MVKIAAKIQQLCEYEIKKGKKITDSTKFMYFFLHFDVKYTIIRNFLRLFADARFNRLEKTKKDKN